MSNMRAMVIREAMDFSVEEVPLPKPGEGEMLLEVEACGLCGSDIRTLKSGHRKITFPWTLGHGICGRVADFAPGYSGQWKKDQRLSIGPLAYNPDDPCCVEGRHELSDGVREIGQAWPGGLAEYVLIPRESIRLGNILPTPEHLDSVHAAIVEPASSCVHAHERAGTGIGQKVLIIGAGPIGCIHTAIARARGAQKIFIADLVAERLSMAEAFGPDELINVSEKDLAREVSRLSEGKGPDVIVTAAPSAQAQIQAVEMVGRVGKVVLFGGLPHGNSKPGIDTNLIHYKNVDLIGLSIFAPRHFRLALDLIASGRIPADKLVTHVLPLEKFNQGAKLAMEGKALKVVFTP